MTVLRKVLFSISIYLFLMIVVSVSSDVISVISDGAETAYTETKSDEITTANETETQDETEYEPMIKLSEQMIKLNESPFDFSVNVLTEAGEETAVYETPYPIHRAEPNDLTAVVIGELNKRKRYFICICKRL